MTHGHLQRRLGLAALLAVTLALPVSARAACVGDCNGDFTITVNELVTGVNIALGNNTIASCPVFDTDNTQAVEIYELTRGVSWIKLVALALNLCVVAYMCYVLRRTMTSSPPS